MCYSFVYSAIILQGGLARMRLESREMRSVCHGNYLDSSATSPSTYYFVPSGAARCKHIRTKCNKWSTETVPFPSMFLDSPRQACLFIKSYPPFSPVFSKRFVLFFSLTFDSVVIYFVVRSGLGIQLNFFEFFSIIYCIIHLSQLI